MGGADAPGRATTLYGLAAKYTAAQLKRLFSSIARVMGDISNRFRPLAAAGDPRVINGGETVAGFFVVCPYRTRPPQVVLLGAQAMAAEDQQQVIGTLTSCADFVVIASHKKEVGACQHMQHIPSPSSAIEAHTTVCRLGRVDYVACYAAGTSGGSAGHSSQQRCRHNTTRDCDGSERTGGCSSSWRQR
jgi:hypothetical protein